MSQVNKYNSTKFGENHPIILLDKQFIECRLHYARLKEKFNKLTKTPKQNSHHSSLDLKNIFNAVLKFNLKFDELEPAKVNNKKKRSSAEQPTIDNFFLQVTKKFKKDFVTEYEDDDLDVQILNEKQQM